MAGRIMTPVTEDRRDVGVGIKSKGQRLFTRRLLRWFRSSGRHYPWRETTDPYKIFVAEFMLQRTGAQQVLPIYRKFVSTFPTLNEAAEADEARLREILRPLGRVERSKVLHRALAQLAGELKGRLPSSLRRLLKIPGVGPYTGRAILVFAHHRRLGLFDPNIYRVVGRIFGLKSTKKRPHTDASMWKTVDDLMPRQRSREMNLALLDLASIVCRTRKPLHDKCPMRDICAYYRRIREAIHLH
jgi:A/G-specific adenine glycosylase